MSDRGRVLVVDDDAALCDLLEGELERRGYACATATSSAAALEHLELEGTDVVLTDVNMPGLDGIALCAHIAERRSGIPVIVFTAFGSLSTAIASIRAGAYDFVTKPIEIDALVLALDRAIRHRALERRVEVLSRALRDTGRFEALIGESAPMRRLFTLLERLAPSEATVLIYGESGTGKELVARALHRRGPRGAGAFVAINCAAVPETLLESELFGHVRGAFTDARADHRGLLEQASGGTLLLDEIGDLPPGSQAKLLRVLEDRRVRPLGSAREVPIDVRVIAATHRDLEALVEEGRFREDLLFRVNVVRLDLPPLRARGNDVLLLAQEFLEQAMARASRPDLRLSRAAAEKLLEYSWPGNVRELRNCIEHAVALARDAEIAVDDLPERVRAHRAKDLVLPGQDPLALVPLEQVERRYILHVLDAVGGNRSEAARVLGLDRKTLYRKLASYGAGAA
jgi:two-component system response regulator HydG